MNFIISASTDKGIVKDTNEDSLFVRTINTSQGRVVLAVLCDGMGGLSKGELASATVLHAFTEWMNHSLIDLFQHGLDDSVIRQQWENIVKEQNDRIKQYGKNHSIDLGTTVTSLLLTDQRYYVMNVGDGRAYEISDELTQITHDHTVVANDVDNGLITREQAESDPRRNVLLQCVGASEVVIPDFFFGQPVVNAVYMLCSDGFRHEIKESEIFDYFNPFRMNNEYEMKTQSDYLIELNKQRLEEDNISVITIRTS